MNYVQRWLWFHQPLIETNKIELKYVTKIRHFFPSSRHLCSIVMEKGGKNWKDSPIEIWARWDGEGFGASPQPLCAQALSSRPLLLLSREPGLYLSALSLSSPSPISAAPSAAVLLRAPPPMTMSLLVEEGHWKPSVMLVMRRRSHCSPRRRALP